ncbi:hypothetical protein [Streptomyces tritici]|uniref:hypothetical protein n=1 Tax=Streptomyces tritici TaxID=2054410 RepID=UPI003AF1A27E
MRRHPHSSLLAAVVGALLLSAAFCFPPLDGSVPEHAPVRAVATATVDPGPGHSEERVPHHPHRHHGADCAAPGLAPQPLVATPYDAADATTVAVDSGSEAHGLQAPAADASGHAVGDTGRSTRIRVCRWRI